MPRIPSLRVTVKPAPQQVQNLQVNINGVHMPNELLGIARPLGNELRDLRRVALGNFAAGFGLIVLVFVASIPLAGGMTRNLRTLMDRQITAIGLEAISRGARSADYPIGWIEVEVDAEGKGEGRLIGAMQLAVEGDRLVMKTYGTEPIRLINVVV